MGIFIFILLFYY